MPCRPAISSMSLGRCYAGHSLEYKLSMAAKYHIQGIEIFYEDLADLARPPTHSNLLSAAAYTRSLCTSLGLEIICLQPFMHYEGLLDRQIHADRIAEIKSWFELAKALSTDLIQVPASFLHPSQISPDTNHIVADLGQLADLGAQQSPPIRFAYESLCWSTYIDTWEACWAIVSRVDRANFGICLDAFNILGRIYADPTAASRRAPDAEQHVRDAVRGLVARLAPHRHKVFLVQIVDAERLGAPLDEGHPFYRAEQPARMLWSRNCRLFYGESERGAYLPVREVADAIVNGIGYDGWVSMELFNRVMEREDEWVVEELARRAAVGWERLVADLGLHVESGRPGLGRQDSTKGEVFDSEVEVARLL